MNIVRARRHTLGQFDPSSDPLLMDVMYPSSQDTSGSSSDFPMYNDPGLITAENVSAAQAAQAASVPKPPGAGTTINFTLPTASPAAAYSATPAPRVAAPGFSMSSLFPSTGMPSWLLLLGAAVGIALIAAPGGRRR